MTPAVEDVMHGAWRSDDSLDVASGRYDEGYASFSINGPADSKPTFDVTHQRDFVFAKPDYWIVADYLTGNDQHHFTFLFHLAPDVIVERISGSSAIVRATSNGARLVIEALSTQHLGSEVIEGSTSPIQGWYSEDHYKKRSAPVLSFSIDRAKSVFVAWVLYPLPAGSDVKEIRASMEYEPDAARTAIEVQHDGQIDCVRLPDCAKSSPAQERSRISNISLERRGDV